MQYNRDSSRRHDPAAPPSIDTGMGLERVAAVLQGKLSNYDTDLIRPIIDRAGELCGIEYGASDKTDTALRINADHARATAFLIHDGVLPSNEGRGYVLRKIMRRAMRNARLIGKQDPYLYQLTGFVAELMRPAYPELMESVQRVARIVKDEEHRYATTFLVAEKVFSDELAQSAPASAVPGHGRRSSSTTPTASRSTSRKTWRANAASNIDREAFETEMQQQRERARASWKGAEKGAFAPAYQQLAPKRPHQIPGIRPARCHLRGHRPAGQSATCRQLCQPDTEAELVLDQTPFYAETGGQVGDRGTLSNAHTGEKVAVCSSHAIRRFPA